MKFGVLGFSYNGFEHFSQEIKEKGYYTSNMGDYAQTIAARHAWRSVGVRNEDIVRVDRDSLPIYDGPPVMLIMNGAFPLGSLPVSNLITPIFIGFSAEAEVISEHADWLRRFAPIGCRDFDTAKICQEHGIYAFVTGCVTLTLPARKSTPANGRLFIVTGWTGLMPSSVLGCIPRDIIETAEFIHHRKVESSIPLSNEQQNANEAYELSLMQRYMDEAALVITPLLHVSSPCLAMKIPVIVCRTSKSSRFDYQERFCRTYFPDDLQSIDWSPMPPDVSQHASNYLDHLRRCLSRYTGSPVI